MVANVANFDFFLILCRFRLKHDFSQITVASRLKVVFRSKTTNYDVFTVSRWPKGVQQTSFLDHIGPSLQEFEVPIHAEFCADFKNVNFYIPILRIFRVMVIRPDKAPSNGTYFGL